jgi:hypothetical protein
MTAFPDSPIPATEFFEGVVPARFNESTLPEAATALEIAWGVHLSGDGGGEWLYQLAGGALEVSAGDCDAAAFTLIQSVDDWRGTLWEGRGGVVAAKGLALVQSERVAGLMGAAAAGLDRAFLERLEDLDGVLRTVLTDGPGGDWSLGVQFGQGPVPTEATTTVSISHTDADALAAGELAPLEAFLAGRVRVEGDMLLMMQLQSLVSEATAGGGEGP